MGINATGKNKGVLKGKKRYINGIYTIYGHLPFPKEGDSAVSLIKTLICSPVVVVVSKLRICV